MNCTLCSAKGRLRYKGKHGGYYDCTRCRAVFLSPDDQPAADAERARYLTHNNDVYDERYQAFVAPIVEAVKASFGMEHRGLDYGCGTGPVISHLLGREGYVIERYDPFFFPNTHALERQYDYIICCEVIEHFHDPREEFARLRNMLTNGGKLVIMTEPLLHSVYFDDWYYKDDPTHVIFYRPETIEYIRERFLFDNAEINGRLIELS